MSFKEPKRARRIRDRSRAIARVQSFLRHSWPQAPRPNSGRWTDFAGLQRSFDSWEEIFAWRAFAARLRHQHPQTCSCAGCGNPRRWFGDLTRQERRFAEAAAAQEREAAGPDEGGAED